MVNRGLSHNARLPSTGRAEGVVVSVAPNISTIASAQSISCCFRATSVSTHTGEAYHNPTHLSRATEPHLNTSAVCYRQAGLCITRHRSGHSVRTDTPLPAAVFTISVRSAAVISGRQAAAGTRPVPWCDGSRRPARQTARLGGQHQRRGRGSGLSHAGV